MNANQETWHIAYAEDFPKDVARLSAAMRLRVFEAITQKLTYNPAHFGKPLRQPKHGFWSLRVGDYRIIYQIIAAENRVQVLNVGHRRDVYDG